MSQQQNLQQPPSDAEVVVSRTALIAQLRRTDRYQEWKKQVFLRDRFTCQHCGARNGRKRVIEADHIISFAKLIKEHQIITVEQAMTTACLWEVGNGRTLCHSCHEKTESYPRNFITKPKKKKRKPASTL